MASRWDLSDGEGRTTVDVVIDSAVVFVFLEFKTPRSGATLNAEMYLTDTGRVMGVLSIQGW